MLEHEVVQKIHGANFETVRSSNRYFFFTSNVGSFRMTDFGLFDCIRLRCHRYSEQLSVEFQ